MKRGTSAQRSGYTDNIAMYALRRDGKETGRWLNAMGHREKQIAGRL